MSFVDDNLPFVRHAKDLADKIEERRVQRLERNRETGVGTLKGLEDIIAKRKLQSAKEPTNAKPNSY